MRPEQLKKDFALWTRAAVGQVIKVEFKIQAVGTEHEPSQQDRVIEAIVSSMQ